MSKLSETLGDLVESSAWHGLPRIRSSRQTAVKVLWACLFLATTGVFLYQLYVLFREYFSYPVKTTISLKHHPMQYPAITFCNINPVKKSELTLTPALARVIGEKSDDSGDDRRKRRSSGILATGNDSSLSFVTNSPTRKTTTSSGTSPGSGTETGSTWDTYYNNTWSWFNSTWYNSSWWYNDTWTDSAGVAATATTSYYDYMYDQFFAKKDVWFERKKRFMVAMRNESQETRNGIGHTKEDMVLSASFSGTLIDVGSFTNMTTTEYGNCYTIESSKYRAWKSGPATGMKLTFNLEIDEYMKNYASAYGIRMVLHNPGTLPLPAEEGITLSPGYETNIGLRVVRVTRLGEPYGKCSDGIEFKQKYKLDYTMTSCTQLCRTENIIAACHCLPPDGPDATFIAAAFVSERVCNYDNLDDRFCMLSVNSGFDDGSLDCDCITPCSDTVYEKTISGRMWPNDEYLEQKLMVSACQKNISSLDKVCRDLAQTPDNFAFEKYRYNFLQVQIYFEDLNYEHIAEDPMYEFARFLSDIGGAMGLFMGGSLLAFAEIFQVILELILFAIHRHKDTGSHKDKSRNKVSAGFVSRTNIVTVHGAKMDMAM